jgi:hypothetical protein
VADANAKKSSMALVAKRRSVPTAMGCFTPERAATHAMDEVHVILKQASVGVVIRTVEPLVSLKPARMTAWAEATVTRTQAIVHVATTRKVFPTLDLPVSSGPVHLTAPVVENATGMMAHASARMATQASNVKRPLVVPRTI